MSDGKSNKLEICTKEGKRFIQVKVGTDVHPAGPEEIEEAKATLKPIMDAVGRDFTWIFTPHTIQLEALLFG